MISYILYSYLLTKKFTFENYRLIGKLLLLDKNYNKKILEKIIKKYSFEKNFVSIQLYTLKRNIQIEWLNSGILQLKNINGNFIYSNWNGRSISFSISTKINKWNFILDDTKESRKRFIQMIYNYIMNYENKIALCFDNNDRFKYYSKNKAMTKINNDLYCSHLLIY